MINKIFYALLLSTVVLSCDNTEKSIQKVNVEPSMAILSEIGTNDFSVVLDDMKIDETENQIIHKHKYKVLELKNDSLHETKKDWSAVNESFFVKHKDDLGMRILSRHDGKVSNIAQPEGFGWAIGNEKHGEWEETPLDSTNSRTRSRRWRTHSTSPFFWLWLSSRRNSYRSDYNSYRTNSAAGHSYYGKTSANTYGYGTRSAYQRKARSSFFQRKSANAKIWSNFKTRTDRSTSRYSNGSTTRSRSGGFGK